jgi:hypothetical protein
MILLLSAGNGSTGMTQHVRLAGRRHPRQRRLGCVVADRQRLDAVDERASGRREVVHPLTEQGAVALEVQTETHSKKENLKEIKT